MRCEWLRLARAGVCVILAMCCLVALAAPPSTADSTQTLSVYIGAHPDDVDIGMSGWLFKHDYKRNPILWIVVTDGAADDGEYGYETDPSRSWLPADKQNNVTWPMPAGGSVTRGFYSAALSHGRCGGYYDGTTWTSDGATHPTPYGNAYGWTVRAQRVLGSGVIVRQLSFVDPNDLTKRWLYPDGSLPSAEEAYTAQISNDIARIIDDVVRTHGYSTDVVYIHSHACAEVALNSGEHSDHLITGNSVRRAIALLRADYGFRKVDATWFTIYGRIEPRPGYTRVDEDISSVLPQVISLNELCWEVGFIHGPFYWSIWPTAPPTSLSAIECTY